MEAGISSTMRRYLFFILIIVTQTRQFVINSSGKTEKSCTCYDQCQKNLTTNSVNDEETTAACQRGCRFHSLILHASHDLNPVIGFAHAKDGCLISCSESYLNPAEVGACNFGCSSVKSTDSCDLLEQQLPQISYSLFIEESGVLMHPGDAEPDDVLIDPGLRKQIEKTLETLLDSKPKLPEIHFRNLPITNKDPPGAGSESGSGSAVEHAPRTTFKCPKFYGFDTAKLQFRSGKITTSDLFFLFSLLLFAVMCFLVSRRLERQVRVWKQLLMSAIQSRHPFMKLRENLKKGDGGAYEDEENDEDGNYPEKTPLVKAANEDNDDDDDDNNYNNDDVAGGEKVDDVTLVFYDDVDKDGRDDVKSHQYEPPPQFLNI